MKIIINKKRIKNLILKINENGDIIISAPYGIKKEFIESFIEKKQSWIKKSREKVLSRKNNLLRYENNEKITIFDNSYNLIIKENKIEHCQIENNNLILYVRDNTFERKKKIFEKFIKELLKNTIYKLTDEISKKTNIYCNEIKIRNMKTRWGSCNVHTKNITYNLKLYSKPIKAIEYVVMHELAHILFPHHQSTFWDFVQQYIPDYKARNELLK